MSTMDVWTVVCKELGRHLQGFCQCTGIMLVSPFLFLLPSAAAMNLDRIGEHAEAMFGVG